MGMKAEQNQTSQGQAHYAQGNLDASNGGNIPHIVVQKPMLRHSESLAYPERDSKFKPQWAKCTMRNPLVWLLMLLVFGTIFYSLYAMEWSMWGAQRASDARISALQDQIAELRQKTADQNAERLRARLPNCEEAPSVDKFTRKEPRRTYQPRPRQSAKRDLYSRLGGRQPAPRPYQGAQGAGVPRSEPRYEQPYNNGKLSLEQRLRHFNRKTRQSSY